MSAIQALLKHYREIYGEGDVYRAAAAELEAMGSAVEAERKACAMIAQFTQGEAIAPFESCGCGKQIAIEIRARGAR